MTAPSAARPIRLHPDGDELISSGAPVGPSHGDFAVRPAQRSNAATKGGCCG